MKRCSKCGEERVGGRCVSCARAAGKRWRDSHKEKRNAASLAWYYSHKEISNARSRANRPGRIANKAIIVGERGGRCEVCGYGTYLGGLDFHHITSKSFPMYQTNMHNMAKAREESLKCVVLCANCHREVHGGVTKIPQHVLDAAYTRYGEWMMEDGKA